MYSTFLAYIFWFLSGFGVLGFHRFYLGKIPTGLLWMFTGGLFTAGAIFDFFTLPGQVREANLRLALYGQLRRQSAPRRSPQRGRHTNWRYANDGQYEVKGRERDNHERAILKLAKENKGIITVSDVALRADISIEEAKNHLETLLSKGFVELRVRKSGALVYVFPDMMDRDDPLEDF